MIQTHISLPIYSFKSIMSQLILILIVSALCAANAEKIECEFVVHSPRGYGCIVKDMEGYSITKVGGVHLPGKSNADVVYFEATSKTLDFIPQGIINHFPNINSMKINFENLAEITEGDLKPFGDKLNYLSISASAIEVIPSNIFASTPNINYMFFTAPHLKSIEHGAFERLENLNGLFVRFPCEDDDATKREDVDKLITVLAIRCHDKTYTFEPKSRLPSQRDSGLKDPSEIDIKTSKSTEGNAGIAFKASAIVVILVAISALLI